MLESVTGTSRNDPDIFVMEMSINHELEITSDGHRIAFWLKVFHRARWEDLPTQYMVVNAFNALEIKEYRGASIEHSVGGVSISNQRILH